MIFKVLRGKWRFGTTTVSGAFGKNRFGIADQKHYLE